MTVVRTCVGCGRRDAQDAMVRLVRHRESLVIDTRGGAPGRGAYLHRRTPCTDTFAKRRGPVRSLRWAPSSTERLRVAGDVMGVLASVG